MKIITRIYLFLSIIALTFIPVFWAWSASVTVTTPVPWVSCWTANDKWEVECMVPTGFAGVQGIFATMIKYFTYIAILWSVLFIIINGIMYSMAGLNDGLKATAKDRITKTLIGLVLLLLSWFILNTLAPWVYR